MVSRYEPLLTINAMVKVGRWTIGPIYYGPPRNCDRCETRHEYVWVCTVDDDVPDDVVQEKLDGRRVWWVGSTCGPTLDEVSKRKWDAPPKELQKKVQLVVDATRAIDEAERLGYDDIYLPWIVDRLALLLDDKLEPRLQRVLRSHVGKVSRALVAIVKERAEAASSSDP